MQHLHLKFVLESTCLSSGMHLTCRYEREAYGGSYGREPAGYARYFRQLWSRPAQYVWSLDNHVLL